MKGFSRWRELGLAVGLVALALWLRWPTFGFSLWNLDEAIHTAAARTLLDGGVLYRDAIDQRTPLSYYAVAGIFALFGEGNLWAVRCCIAVLVAATGWLLFLAGRSLRDAVAGVAAALLYVLLGTAVLFQADANAAHTEWFVAFFTSAGAAVFLTGGTDANRRRLFATGLLFGCAFLSKQPALLDAAAPLAALLYAGWRNGNSIRDHALRILALIAGWATPVLLTVAYFAARGALRDAVFYTWSYNLAYYGPEIATADRIAAAILPFRLIAASQPWLLAVWAAGALRLLQRLLQRGPSPQERTANGPFVFVAAWSLAALAGAASGGRDFQHYTIQFLAPFCLGAGPVLSRLTASTQAESHRRVRWAVALLLLGLVGYEALRGAAVARRRTLPEDPSLRVSTYIREHSPARAKIFVWGYQPDIYFLSDRLPASRFLYASFLTGLVPWTNGARDRDTTYAIVPGTMETLLRDLNASQPEFIVDCSAGPNRFWEKYPLDKFPALNAFVRAHYRQQDSQQFVPQGFRLFQRLRPGEVDPEAAAPLLPAALADTLTLGTLARSLVPLRASARNGADVTTASGHVEYFLHAPSSLTYRVPAGAAFLRGGFGFRPGAYAPENHGSTDGAEFIVRWRPDGGAEQILFRRLLRPREEAADRGLQAFRIGLPANSGGELELVIGVGPNDNSASDWTYWADLMLETR